MKNIERYNEAIDKAKGIAKGLLTDSAMKEMKENSDKFKELTIAEKYMKVPLVGVFSAGKSSLLNVFTGKAGVLPIDTMPLTAISYELYYDTNERVEQYRDGKKVCECGLEGIGGLSTEPGDIAKVYMESGAVKDLQEKGIVLVDMPGIGSGFERHDAAVSNYIGKGTAFALVMDAEQGSLRESTIQFMKEMNIHKLKTAVIISKADKKSEEALKEIVDVVKYQTKDLTDSAPMVATVSAANNDIKGFTNFLASLDTEELAKDKFAGMASGIIKGAINNLRTQIEAKNTSIADIDSRIENINKEIAEQKSNPTIESENADTPAKSTNDILENIRIALEGTADSIASMVMRGADGESVKSTIISIIRAELISSFREETEQYASALSVAVNNAVENIANIKVDTEGILDSINLTGAISIVSSLLPQYKLVGVIAKLLAPILDAFRSEYSAQQKKERIKAQLKDENIPVMIENMRPSILEIVTENQRKITKELQYKALVELEKAKEVLQSKANDAARSKEEIQTSIEKMNGAIAVLEEISNSIK